MGRDPIVIYIVGLNLNPNKDYSIPIKPVHMQAIGGGVGGNRYRSPRRGDVQPLDHLIDILLKSRTTTRELD
jgi:hypothetical protein